MLAGRRCASISRGPGFAWVLALALTACSTACADAPEPCGERQLVDVHFTYATQTHAHGEEMVETRECVHVFVGLGSDGAGLIVLDCGEVTWAVDVEGIRALELDGAGPGQTVTARSQVAEPESLACGERGWLAIDDADGRLLLAVAALQTPSSARRGTVKPETTLELGELGPVALVEDTRDGCPGLTLSASAAEVWVPAASTTAIELGGVAWVVELGQLGGSGCRTAGYDLLLLRAG
jgi:hypothetical protein